MSIPPTGEPPSDEGSALARLTGLLGGAVGSAVGSAVGGWVPGQRPELAAAGSTGPAAGVAARVRASPQALLWLVAAALGTMVVAGYVLSRPHGSGVTSAPTVRALPAPVVSGSPVGLVVDVGGRVRHPGLVTLPPGSRVADAVKAAGGALRPSDLAAVNLAGRVSDGQLLLIGVTAVATGGGGGATGTASGAAGPVSLNSATVEQLDALPGVGPVLAQRIVGWREDHGGFRSVDQLRQVPGIGDRKYADLQALVTA